MHSYNPLLLPDTITIIVQKLPLVSLSIALCINHIWNKEVKLELHMRHEKFKNQYWKTISDFTMLILLKKKKNHDSHVYSQKSPCIDKHIQKR